MNSDNIEQHIEALIFASERSISFVEIKQIINDVNEGETPDERIELFISNIIRKYDQESMAIELVQNNGGYQFLTKKDFYPVINQLHIQRSKKKLGQAAMETLAIIAYKQPITKLEVEQIRGVNCDYTLQKLLERELIKISGKLESIGKPILYSTGAIFMDYFDINSINELPQLKDLISEDNEVGQQSE